MKAYADRCRRTIFHNLPVDDVIYMRKRQNKLMSAYDPSSYIVQGIKGSMIPVRRGDKIVFRNS